MVKRKLTVGGLISCLASVSHFHKESKKEEILKIPNFVSCKMFPTCNFFLEYNPRFSVAPFQEDRKGPRRTQSARLHFPNKTM